MNNAVKPILGLGTAVAISAGLFLWLSEVQRQRAAGSAARAEIAPGRVNIEVLVKDRDGRVQPSLSLLPSRSGSKPGQDDGRRNHELDLKDKDGLAIQVGGNTSVAYTIIPGPGQVVVQTPASNLDVAVHIRLMGSDTMLQITTAWAEAYHKLRPTLYIETGGGGTGIGISALAIGSTEICGASREFTPKEKAYVKERTGKDVKEFIEWTLSPAGQRIVEQEGFVSLI